ncbi:MAG: TorF family putative porin [Gammaproteobacteria bacterium]|nr:TorF family putative porin [Gammaproteobacteria bacterium]
MNKIRLLTLFIVLNTLYMSPVVAEVTGNIGVSNNYIWRGVTQTDDEAAVSGGIDYSHKSGLYIGTWFSNMGDGAGGAGYARYEQDLYAGFAGKSGEFGYDAGLIMYRYPVDNSIDFTELYGKIKVKNFGFGMAFTIDSDAGGLDSDFYMHASAAFEIKKNLMAEALFGNYQFDNPLTEDYMHFKLGLVKDDLGFAIEKNDRTAPDEDDMRLTVSWSKEVAL